MRLDNARSGHHIRASATSQPHIRVRVGFPDLYGDNDTPEIGESSIRLRSIGNGIILAGDLLLTLLYSLETVRYFVDIALSLRVLILSALRRSHRGFPPPASWLIRHQKEQIRTPCSSTGPFWHHQVRASTPNDSHCSRLRCLDALTI